MNGITIGAAVTGAVVFLIGALRTAIRNSLPESVRIEPVGLDAAPGSIRELARAFEELGFRQIGIRRIHLQNPAVLAALVREDGGAFATAYRVEDGANSKIVCDVVTPVATREGTLTTSMDVGAGCLTIADDSFMQIFPGGSPDELWHRHQLALKFLREQGVGVHPCRDEEFDGRVAGSFPRQRRKFEEAPWRNTIVALWRVLTKSSPYTGPVAVQRPTAAKVSNLKTGGQPRSRDAVLERVDH